MNRLLASVAIALAGVTVIRAREEPGATWRTYPKPYEVNLTQECARRVRQAERREAKRRG
jgi:hypothetical protein